MKKIFLQVVALLVFTLSAASAATVPVSVVITGASNPVSVNTPSHISISAFVNNEPVEQQECTLTDEQWLWTVVNVQRSTDNGTTWTVATCNTSFSPDNSSSSALVATCGQAGLWRIRVKAAVSYNSTCGGQTNGSGEANVDLDVLPDAQNGQFTSRVGTSSITYEASTLDPNTPTNQAQTPKSVCAGEEMQLTIFFKDKDYYRATPTSPWQDITGTGPYEVVLTISGDAAFGSPDGAATRTETGNEAKNIRVFVKSNAFSAGRASSITVTATLKDNALPATPPNTGSAKDNDYSFSWTFLGRTSPSPTSMEQISPSAPFGQWRSSTPTNAPEYIYQMKPDDPTVVQYQNQTVQEEFGQITAFGFTADSLKDTWKANSGIDFMNDSDALNKAARLLFSSGTNGSFVITTYLGPDQIKDRHPGMGGDGTWVTAFKPDVYYPTFPNGNPNPLYLPSGFGFVLPQTYLCCGNPIGNYTITRVVKRENGTTQFLVNKTGP